VQNLALSALFCQQAEASWVGRLAGKVDAHNAHINYSLLGFKLGLYKVLE
jgi:hypothetical protein